MAEVSTKVWMPWYPADYLRDTSTLSLEEDAVYRRALDFLWQNPAGLPRDMVRLSRGLRVSTEEIEKCWPHIVGFFFVNGDYYQNKRINEEREKANNRANIARNNGSHGGRPKKENPRETQEKPSGLANDNPNHNPEKSSSPSPSQSKTERNNAHVDEIANKAYAAYPDSARKDGRTTSKGVVALAALKHAVSKAPDFPWEEYANLISEFVSTPKNLTTWAQIGADHLGLESLRALKAKAQTAKADEWIPPHRRPI